MLFDCYDDKAYLASYCDRQGEVNVTLGMIGFVDDCNGQTVIPEMAEGQQATLKAPLHQAQHNAQTWTNLLTASGGAPELSKCSFNVVQWQFYIQGAPVLIPTTQK
jgi:hypothetical protein